MTQRHCLAKRCRYPLLVCCLCAQAFGAPAMAQPSADKGDQYSLSAPMIAMSPSGNRPLGNLEVCVIITPAADTPRLSFLVIMPDAPGELFVQRIRASHGKDDTYTFNFEDNYGNDGKGSLKVNQDNATLRLHMTRQAEGPAAHNIGRNYGSFQLQHQACKDAHYLQGHYIY